MRDILVVLGVCLAAIIVGACLFFYGPSLFREKVTSEEAGSQTEPVDIAIRVLDTGTNALEAPKRKNFAVYDADEFKKLWENAHDSDGTPLPKIDFDTEYVIGVFAGTKSSGGHAITIEKITESEGVRTVYITMTKPAAGCVTSQALTSPYEIVAVPFSGASLMPNETTIETPC
ncbi:MAG: hypothetical protein AB199_04035 [Parcubacteria bacterium C7867-004]|nr:MAG: hypothetical protein AB199_04035 [Parcubacteria bacterium C7867-004]